MVNNSSQNKNRCNEKIINDKNIEVISNLKNYSYIVICFLLIFIVVIFCMYFKQENKEIFDFKIITQLLYKEQNRFVVPYIDTVSNRKGFFFIGKKSEFFDLEQNKSTSVKELDNITPIYAAPLDNKIIIFNWKNNVLEKIEYDIKTQKIINKNTQINIGGKYTNIGTPFVNSNKKNTVYIPIFKENGENQIIILYENFRNYKIIENKLENIKGTIIQPEGLYHFLNIGGYNKNTKKHSNAIYTTFDFKTEKLFLETNIKENSNCFWVNYYGIPDKQTGSYNVQEIWIINNRTLEKIDIFTKKIKQEELPKEFEKCKIFKIVKIGKKQICFIEKGNKIYYFEIKHNKKIKTKYLMDNFSNNILFTTLPLYSLNKKIYVFVN